jgi:hypothetical protein
MERLAPSCEPSTSLPPYKQTAKSTTRKAAKPTNRHDPPTAAGTCGASPPSCAPRATRPTSPPAARPSRGCSRSQSSCAPRGGATRRARTTTGSATMAAAAAAAARRRRSPRRPSLQRRRRRRSEGGPPRRRRWPSVGRVARLAALEHASRPATFLRRRGAFPFAHPCRCVAVLTLPKLPPPPAELHRGSRAP